MALKTTLSLGQRQEVFAENFAKLILWCKQQGYGVRLGEVLRPELVQEEYLRRSLTKVTVSQHQKKLAGDILLFKAGKYLTDTPSYAAMGKYWVSLHPDNRWGGDWDRDGDYQDEKFCDGNHVEMMG